jgi:hypothetical protein
MRPLRTIAGAVIESSSRCTPGRIRCGERAAPGTRGRVLRSSKIEEVCALGFVEPQRSGERLQHGLGDARRVAALELRVVGDADSGKRCDLFPPQARYAPAAAAVAA